MHILLGIIIVLVLIALCGGLLTDENGRRALVRAWVVLTAIWIGLIYLIIGRASYVSQNEVFWVSVAPPAAIFALGVALRWIFGGFARE